MKIISSKRTGIPRLAWCLIKEINEPIIKLLHGSDVEAEDEFFIEGVWDGEYVKKEIHTAHALMGSGGCIHDNKLIVCCPSHTSEGLYSLKADNGSLYISNSIPFILTQSNHFLDPDYPDYESDMLSISDGLDSYKKSIPLIGNQLSIHYFCNLLINQQGDIEVRKKIRTKDFMNYEDYYTTLLDTLKKISDNASDGERTSIKYKPIVFCSTGYDSTACAALGRKIGCSEAVVYESKRSYKKDSGKAIVERLGYEKVVEKHELDYLHYSTAHEFVSSGELGTSIFFASSEAELAGKFLLSGSHGDVIWNKKLPASDDIKRSFYPDTAKKEFRLRVGFINVLVPFFNVQSFASINCISNSEEMQPWSLSNSYDRPIPRRIAENAGVPREWFGTKKHGGAGSNLRFANLWHLKKVMSYESFSSFYAFYLKTKRLRLKCFKRHIPYLLYCANIVLEAKGIGVLERMLKISNWDRKLKCSPWAPSYLFLWGTDELRKMYKANQLRDNSALLV
ncbi:hypothetical protein P6709_03245 [Jeotgalibacillus sp. ET6]|uniref:hypothetical protein n=1 Tax=Jeotgalibacillus sp. ET6 TaxID=3037260 RepID=UPI0024183493|nr:hypothetical protein [Jeotgalibacillus sp. ET6]MDG5470749.1 hypothetical protein [Jeotgalibacillus sp. ET6]